MRASKWTVRGPSGEVDLELHHAGGPRDAAAQAESRDHIAYLAYGFRHREPQARRVVFEICAQLGVLPLGGLRESALDFDTGSARSDAIAGELRRAVDSGRLVARSRKIRRVIMYFDAPADAGGPEADAPEPDVYVLAAEMKLIGDTPLINHAVRVLDPDTGEVVADGLTTDENGIVRTDVPANKTYRIEIIDRDPDVHAPPTLAVKHPVLRCAFVDMAGSPVADLDVTVKDLDGNEASYTSDEGGMLEVPAQLGLYEVDVGDDSYWVHSLMHSDDDDDAYEIVVPSQLEDGGDGLDPDDRLTRSWDDDGDDDDDDDDSDDSDGDGDSA